MGVLHVLGQPPSSREAWRHCRQRMVARDALLLVADAVYAIDQGALLEPFQVKGVSLYALLPDMLARGVRPDEPSRRVGWVDFEGFVDLTVKYQRVLMW